MSRFLKQPGSRVLSSTEDQSMFLIAADDPLVPDDVRLPDSLGGGIKRVRRGFVAPCPACGEEAFHLSLEGALNVAECLCKGFLWYRSITFSLTMPDRAEADPVERSET